MRRCTVKQRGINKRSGSLPHNIGPFIELVASLGVAIRKGCLPGTLDAYSYFH